MGRAPSTRLSSDYGKVSESTANQRFELEDGVIEQGHFTLEPIPAEVAVVDEIRVRVLDGEGLSRIADDLNDRCTAHNPG